MIIPSIDIQNGRVVQLRQGKDLILQSDRDPIELVKQFSICGEVAVIDLDAAMANGSNEALIAEMVKHGRCRVGGGIRDVETAIKWLDRGARKVILGTAATPELLSQLPRSRVMAAVDIRDGKVSTQGWTNNTSQDGLDTLRSLREYVSGFLVTNIGREGTLAGLDKQFALDVKEAAGEVPVTLAGGISTLDEIKQLDAMGMDAQVGMAMYQGHFTLGQGFAACLKSDRDDGLIPTVVCNENGVCLGLVYSSKESLAQAIDEEAGIYYSRKRGIWKKGESSGNLQKLIRIDRDCDSDALQFTVQQEGDGFCHLGRQSCFGVSRSLDALEERIDRAIASTESNSYTKRLLSDANLLNSKIKEEAAELAEAESREDVTWEAADLLYFATVKLRSANLNWADIWPELESRSLRINRRRGDAK
ncbi:MAG: phosphoribosyl-ATP diphosphatase [Fimbriimonadaceae bacterium]